MVKALDKQAKLDEIEQAITEQNICAELAEQAQALVFGSGNPDAEVMFVGEAPGKQEDLHGLPFVGAAGRLLDELLNSIELNRADTYITNIVKYRPPDNRDPLPAEKAAFLPVLQRQIEAISPKIIVTLGRHSMEYFLPGARISDVHGQPKQVRVQLAAESDIPLVILPLYHPAAALYNGALRQTLFDDFASIPATIASLENEINQ